MGEGKSTGFRADFNRAIQIEFTDERITSNSGVVLLRQIDHKLGLCETIAGKVYDPRRADRIRYRMIELLRERVYAMALGYSAQDDVDRLAHDPAFRMAVWDRPGEAVLDERLASQPTQSRLVDILARHRGNRRALRNGLFESVRRAILAGGDDRRVLRGTIDIDSFPIEIHGEQQGGNYNGHYRCTAYHPLVASFSVGGDYDSSREGLRLGNGFIHAILRQGSVHTASGARRFIRHVAAQARELAVAVDYRIDAGYTSGAIMDSLTDENLKFIGRLRGNSRLDELAAPHIYRPPGRPPAAGYETVIELGMHQVDGWRHPQRLLLVVVDQPDSKSGQLDLFPRHFFLVTNWKEDERTAENLLGHYRKRGTFEDRLGEFNQAVGTHLSSQEFDDNEVTLLLALLAYNLASLARLELEDEVGGCWDLKRFQLSVLKAGGRVTKHARRLLLRVAQSVQQLWILLQRRIDRWKPSPQFEQPKIPQSRRWTPPPKHAFLNEVLRL
jgi:hypothetical protein